MSQGRRDTVSPFFVRADVMNTPLAIELRTERLLLRPLSIADAPAIERLAGDERVARFTSNIPHPYPDGAAKAFVSESLDKQARDEVRTFAITLAGNPQDLIGMVGLIDRGASEVEIGYWLGVSHWGDGLMSEAVAAVAAHGRDWRPGATLAARTFPDNHASQRVLEKAGFVRRGTGVCDAPARDQERIEDAPLYVLEPPAA